MMLQPLTTKKKKEETEEEDGRMETHSWDRPETDSKLSRWRWLTAFIRAFLGREWHGMSSRDQFELFRLVRYSFVQRCTGPDATFSYSCLFCTHINRVSLQQKRQHQHTSGSSKIRRMSTISLRALFSSSRLFLLWFRLCRLDFCASALQRCTTETTICTTTASSTKRRDERIEERDVACRRLSDSESVTYVDGGINHKK